MGKLISCLEKKLYSAKNKRVGGTVLVVTVCAICTAVPGILLYFAWRISPWLYFTAESLLCWQLQAAKSLKSESNKVYAALKSDDLAAAKAELSMIVGRDTDVLDEKGVTRAVVETVAENTSDGVVAPLFYMAFGGSVLGCLYKAVNTMDSMLGYKNERYVDFGFSAAGFDDVFNFIPSRLSALLMISAAWFSRMDAENAYKIWRRDRRNHPSPNSAQPESVMAGALGVKLAGNSYYGGVLCEKPYIGDDVRPIEPEDILRSHKILYITAFITFLSVLAVRGINYVLL
jgi:adenosylcobinamide-phosphate synthase